MAHSRATTSDNTDYSCRVKASHLIVQLTEILIDISKEAARVQGSIQTREDYYFHNSSIFYNGNTIPRIKNTIDRIQQAVTALSHFSMWSTESTLDFKDHVLLYQFGQDLKKNREKQDQQISQSILELVKIDKEKSRNPAISHFYQDLENKQRAAQEKAAAEAKAKAEKEAKEAAEEKARAEAAEKNRLAELAKFRPLVNGYIQQEEKAEKEMSCAEKIIDKLSIFGCYTSHQQKITAGKAIQQLIDSNDKPDYYKVGRCSQDNPVLEQDPMLKPVLNFCWRNSR